MDELLKSLQSLETKSKKSAPKSNNSGFLSFATMIGKPFANIRHNTNSNTNNNNNDINSSNNTTNSNNLNIDSIQNNTATNSTTNNTGTPDSFPTRKNSKSSQNKSSASPPKPDTRDSPARHRIQQSLAVEKNFDISDIDIDESGSHDTIDYEGMFLDTMHHTGAVKMNLQNNLSNVNIYGSHLDKVKARAKAIGTRYLDPNDSSLTIGGENENDTGSRSSSLLSEEVSGNELFTNFMAGPVGSASVGTAVGSRASIGSFKNGANGKDGVIGVTNSAQGGLAALPEQNGSRGSEISDNEDESESESESESKNNTNDVDLGDDGFIFTGNYNNMYGNETNMDEKRNNNKKNGSKHQQRLSVSQVSDL